MTTDPPTSPVTSPDAPTGEVAAIFRAPAQASPVSEELFEVLFAGEVDAWPARATHRGLRLRWPIAVTVGLLLALGGMGLGSYLQRTRPTSATTLFSRLSSLASRSGLGAFARGGASAAGATVGTVTDVTGHTLYVTTASGSLVKVVVGASTVVDRTTVTALGGLAIGDSVVVVGSTSHGAVSAKRVTASAKGVSSASGPVP